MPRARPASPNGSASVGVGQQICGACGRGFVPGRRQLVIDTAAGIAAPPFVAEASA